MVPIGCLTLPEVLRAISHLTDRQDQATAVAIWQVERLCHGGVTIALIPHGRRVILAPGFSPTCETR